MCGRYTLTKPLKAIKKHFEPIILSCDHNQRYNISPGQNNPVVTMTNSQRELKLMRWGFIPSWTKDIKTTKQAAIKVTKAILFFINFSELI